jgi:DNA-binding NtrC family response regulator
VLEHLSAIGARFLGRPIGIEPDALALLLEHDWPGNEAELVGVVTRAGVTAGGPTIRRADIAYLLRQPRISDAVDEERSSQAKSDPDRRPRTRRAN